MAKSDADIQKRLDKRKAESEKTKAKFSQLFPYLLEHKKVLIVVLALSLLGALASLAQPLLVAEVIARVEQATPLGDLVWILIAIVVLGALISSFEHYLLQRTGEGVVLSSRKHLVSRMLKLPIAEFDSRRTGDLVSRVGSDTTLLRAVLTQGLVEAIGGAVTFVGAVIAMLIIDAVLFGLTASVVAVAITTVAVLSRRIRAASRIAQERVGELASSTERAISAIRTVRASNATERETEKIAEDAKNAWRAGITVAKISALVMPIAGIALQVAFLVVLGVGGYRVASGAIQISDLVAFIMFLFMMIMPLGQAFGAFSAVNQALGALGRIQEIIALPSEGASDAAGDAPTSASDSEEHLAAEGSRRAASIEFRNVVFSYPESAHKSEEEKIIAEALGEEASSEEKGRAVLRSVSFTAPAGKRTAFVGPSGAGKSTLLALVERFYDPDSGQILLDGEDVRSISRHELRAQLGYVEQDAPVLAGSLRDNLTLAAPEASDDDLVRVLRAVNLGEVLDRDPAGLNAQVGEDGVRLSGGERQRLAIARTLLAAPPILLLDESTSSLDGLNEQRLKDAIDEVSKERTLLVIAHRLSTVVDSDQIVVLDEGKVIGIGTHAELLKTTPLYRELAEQQLLS